MPRADEYVKDARLGFEGCEGRCRWLVLSEVPTTSFPQLKFNYNSNRLAHPAPLSSQVGLIRITITYQPR